VSKLAQALVRHLVQSVWGVAGLRDHGLLLRRKHHCPQCLSPVTNRQSQQKVRGYRLLVWGWRRFQWLMSLPQHLLPRRAARHKPRQHPPSARQPLHRHHMEAEAHSGLSRQWQHRCLVAGSRLAQALPGAPLASLLQVVLVRRLGLLAHQQGVRFVPRPPWPSARRPQRHLPLGVQHLVPRPPRPSARQPQRHLPLGGVEHLARALGVALANRQRLAALAPRRRARAP